MLKILRRIIFANTKDSLPKMALFLLFIGIAFSYQNSYSSTIAKDKNSSSPQGLIEKHSVAIGKKDDPPSLSVVAEGSDGFGMEDKASEQETAGSEITKWASALIGLEKREAKTLNVPEEFKTIQSAINSARRGDSIKVAEGEYKENIIMKNSVILEGSGADKTILDGDNLGNVVTFKGAYDTKTDLSGFTIKNSGKSLSGILVENSSPWIHDNIIAENEYGIYIKGESRPVIQKNVIRFANKGIQVYNFKIQTEEENKEEDGRDGVDGSDVGLGIDNGISVNTNPNIIDNLITDNKIGIDLYFSTAKIEHNSISYNNHYKTYLGATFGISLNGSSAEITSNIVSDNGICELCTGVNADVDSKNVIISYNDIWNNKNNYACSGECVLEENNISEDPLYVDTMNGDYNLQAESVLIGRAKDGLDIGIRR